MISLACLNSMELSNMDGFGSDFYSGPKNVTWFQVLSWISVLPRFAMESEI
jgi:hypothetical protein